MAFRLQPDDLEKLGITNMPELKAERWKKMNVSEKVAVFKECERRISQYEDRKTIDVIAINMSKFAKIYKECEGADSIFRVMEDDSQIILDDQFLSTATSYKAFEKYAHEAAHAYQEYSMKNPGFHPSDLELSEWKEARKNYPRENSLRLAGQRYVDNALEIDARCFSQPCSRRLKWEHEMQRAEKALKQELSQKNLDDRERER